MRTLGVVQVLLLSAAPLLPDVAHGQNLRQQSSSPEESRFDNGAFYDGLKKRGLTDLLRLHLEAHPPAEDVTAMLLSREVKLAEYADASRDTEARRRSLRESNVITETLIETYPDDDRSDQWRLSLARSLIYEEGAPFTTNILYRGGSRIDRENLLGLMNRAIAILGELYERLNQQYEDLENLSSSAYDRLEASGEIDKLEENLALSDYQLAWARFYRGVARMPENEAYADDFRAALEYLEDRSSLLETPHSVSHYQAQALVLAGMSNRRLGDQGAARVQLGRAIDTVDVILDRAERASLRWVLTLSRLELVRSFSESGSYAAALSGLEFIRDPTDDEQLMIALAERQVHLNQATRLADEGNATESERLREISSEGLKRLAEKNDSDRARVYSALYDLLRDVSSTARLTVFERCALISGCLREADSAREEMSHLIDGGESTESNNVKLIEQRRTRLLQRAIEIGESVIRDGRIVSPMLAAEASFNLGVAYYQRGRRLEAAKSFNRVASRYSQYGRAIDAATFAVQLGWELNQDGNLAVKPDVVSLYDDALSTLTEKFGDDERAKYWTFFRGQHLSNQGEFEKAADAYERVEADHPRYAEAVYLRAESIARALQEFAVANPTEFREIVRRATAGIRAIEDAESTLKRLLENKAASRNDSVSGLIARSRVLLGDVCVVPGVRRFERALDSVAGFEEKYGRDTSLVGRVLRIRMIAYEGLGRLEDAARLIPEFVAQDPVSAIGTLQGLYAALNEDIERDLAAGRESDAKKRAQSAAVIADGIYKTSLARRDELKAETIYAMRLQLAETLLKAEQRERARSLFDESLAEDKRRYDDGESRDARALMGAAEARYSLGEHDAALPLFNKVHRGAKQGSDLWWQSLLRDLQCRTALEADPSTIARVIHQQKFLNSEMGGSKTRREFELLLLENERRQRLDENGS